MSMTIQTNAVKLALHKLGHATNQQLHDNVLEQFPALSATTVHRITTRLIENNEIGYAPTNGKSVVLDTNPLAHEHFMCKVCGGLKDITLTPAVFETIQKQIGGNVVSNGLVICGTCADCARKGA